MTLTFHPHTDSILLGYSIGHADTDAGRMEIVASGNTVRFTLAGVDGYCDLKLGDYAAQALEMLTNDAARASA